ncbi:unnamed protein product [Microthlaspi erraticum]|uniref:Uncharacterized protein n=1 Tax=Microthlaspi erraticum TaxID=1685480 RepID=A0A6D2KRK5_9BRAS|nr:unnamed protein product [Microthlaspi erraticum]
MPDINSAVYDSSVSIACCLCIKLCHVLSLFCFRIFPISKWHTVTLFRFRGRCHGLRKPLALHHRHPVLSTSCSWGPTTESITIRRVQLDHGNHLIAFKKCLSSHESGMSFAELTISVIKMLSGNEPTTLLQLVRPLADWVKITVKETFRIQSDPTGKLIITGQPEQLDNPWGITPFNKTPQQHHSIASHFHLYPLVEKLNDAIESGTRDQNSDALVSELNSHFEKCQQLLNSISGSLGSKTMTVDGQK